MLSVDNNLLPVNLLSMHVAAPHLAASCVTCCSSQFRLYLRESPRSGVLQTHFHLSYPGHRERAAQSSKIGLSEGSGSSKPTLFGSSQILRTTGQRGQTPTGIYNKTRWQPVLMRIRSQRLTPCWRECKMVEAGTWKSSVELPWDPAIPLEK